jgi:molecular chaperone DnaJ
MPDVTGRGRGDLLVTVKVKTPKKLTRDQKKLLQQLAATLPADELEPTPLAAQEGERGLFDRVKDIFG